MIIAQAHGLGFRFVDHLIVEGEIGYGNEENTVGLHVLSVCFQKRVVVVVTLTGVGEVKAYISPRPDIVIVEIIGAVGAAQIAHMDFTILPSQ